MVYQVVVEIECNFVIVIWCIVCVYLLVVG